MSSPCSNRSSTSPSPSSATPWITQMAGALFRSGEDREPLPVKHSLTLLALIGVASARTAKKSARTGGLTDESVCPTSLPKDLLERGAGASACQHPTRIGARLPGPGGRL